MNARHVLAFLLPCVVSVLFVLGSTGCSEDEPTAGELEDIAVAETEELLLSTDWRVADVQVVVRESGLPTPALASVANAEGMVPSGIYTAQELFPETDLDVLLRFKKDSRVIEENVDGAGFEDLGSTYRVLDASQMKLTIRGGEKLNYDYDYDREEEQMALSADEASARVTVKKMSDRISTVIFSGAVEQLSEALAEQLVGNPAVREAVDAFLFDLIRGKLDPLTELDAEMIAAEFAQVIVDAINQADLEPIIAAILEPRLETLTELDAEAVSAEIAADIAAQVRQKFSAEEMTELVLPLFERRDLVDPQVRAQQIAEFTVVLLQVLLDEEDINAAIEARLEDFIALPAEDVDSAADQLATVVEDKWLNVDNLATVILPYAEQLDATPIAALPAMASDITDQVEAIVGVVNARFPELGLAPDFETIESVILVALTAAKPVVAVAGPQQVSEDIATAILGVLNHEFLTDAFATAVTKLQSVIDPAIAADAVTTWLVTVIEEAQPDIVEAIADALTPILAELDPEQIATTVGMAISRAITDTLSEDALFDLVLPLVTRLTLLDPARAAADLAAIVVDSGLIPEFEGTRLEEALVPIIEELIDVDVDGLSQALVDTLLDSELLSRLVTPERVARILNLALYTKLIERGQRLHAIQGIEFELDPL